MKKLDFYWMTKEEWFHQNPNGTYSINEDAPKEAQDSYKHYLEQTKGDFA